MKRNYFCKDTVPCGTTKSNKTMYIDISVKIMIEREKQIFQKREILDYKGNISI